MEAGRDDHRVNLTREIPVFIVYFTTYVRDGGLYFGNDLYQRDSALVRAVAPGAMPNRAASDALARLRKLARD